MGMKVNQDEEKAFLPIFDYTLEISCPLKRVDVAKLNYSFGFWKWTGVYIFSTPSTNTFSKFSQKNSWLKHFLSNSKLSLKKYFITQ